MQRSLSLARKLAKLLEQKSRESGCVELESSEPEFTVDENGVCIDVKPHGTGGERADDRAAHDHGKPRRRHAGGEASPAVSSTVSTKSRIRTAWTAWPISSRRWA